MGEGGTCGRGVKRRVQRVGWLVRGVRRRRGGGSDDGALGAHLRHQWLRGCSPVGVAGNHGCCCWCCCWWGGKGGSLGLPAQGGSASARVGGWMCLCVRACVRACACALQGCSPRQPDQLLLLLLLLLLPCCRGKTLTCCRCCP